MNKLRPALNRLGTNHMNRFSMTTGETPLTHAARSNSVTGLRLLLDAKADPDGMNRDGDTAMMIAAQRVYLGVVKNLLYAAADVGTAKNSEGMTAVDIAHASGHHAMWSMLKEVAPRPDYMAVINEQL